MVSAIITAAGKGTRFNSTLPKQYLDLAGRPVLSRTVAVFADSGLMDEIILVIPEADMACCRDMILSRVAVACPVRLVAGGKHRQDSVRNGLRAVAGGPGRIVVIHDGARPFVTGDLIRRCLDGLGPAGPAAVDGCIAAVPAGDTLKRTDRDGYIIETLDRSGVWLAQTPQVFRHDAVLRAHETALARGWTVTDDAALLERAGGRVAVVPGSALNIKITTPDDLPLAEAIAGAFFN